MAEKTYLKNINVDGTIYGLGLTPDDFYSRLGITEERFVELLSRDLYCPTLTGQPSASTLVYTDTDGSVNHFRAGQPCRWQEGSTWRIAVCTGITASTSSWHILPVALSELANDADLATNASVDTKTSALRTQLEASMTAHRTEVADTQEAHEEAVDKRLTDMQVEFETLITEHRDYMYGKLTDMQSTVDESNAAATEAERVSYQASATATQASTDAAAAKAAVATLEGLAGTTTAQQTLAAQVAQIEENKQVLSLVPNFELVKETTYDL